MINNYRIDSLMITKLHKGEINMKSFTYNSKKNILCTLEFAYLYMVILYIEFHNELKSSPK